MTANGWFQNPVFPRADSSGHKTAGRLHGEDILPRTNIHGTRWRARSKDCFDRVTGVDEDHDMP